MAILLGFLRICLSRISVSVEFSRAASPLDVCVLDRPYTETRMSALKFEPFARVVANERVRGWQRIYDERTPER